MAKALQVNYRPVANIKAIKPNQKGDKDIQANYQRNL